MTRFVCVAERRDPGQTADESAVDELVHRLSELVAKHRELTDDPDGPQGQLSAWVAS